MKNKTQVKKTQGNMSNFRFVPSVLFFSFSRVLQFESFESQKGRIYGLSRARRWWTAAISARNKNTFQMVIVRLPRETRGDFYGVSE